MTSELHEIEAAARDAAEFFSMELARIEQHSRREALRFVLRSPNGRMAYAEVSYVDLEYVRVLRTILIAAFREGIARATWMDHAVVPLPEHPRMVVSGFSPRNFDSAGPDPSYYVRPATDPRLELARYASVEDAAVAHAVSLEPPEVDFINRALE